jgi:hypothetical protein
MKLFVLTAISLLSVSAPAMAQMTPMSDAPASTMPTEMSKTTMPMMEQCTHMMSMMQMMGEGLNMMGEPGTEGAMGEGMNVMPDSLRFDTATAEALARAFLSGRSPSSPAPILLEVDRADGSYLVSYRQGASEGVLLVDAMTGVVKEQP